MFNQSQSSISPINADAITSFTATNTAAATATATATFIDVTRIRKVKTSEWLNVSIIHASYEDNGVYPCGGDKRQLAVIYAGMWSKSHIHRHNYSYITLVNIQLRT